MSVDWNPQKIDRRNKMDKVFGGFVLFLILVWFCWILFFLFFFALDESFAMASHSPIRSHTHTPMSDVRRFLSAEWEFGILPLKFPPRFRKVSNFPNWLLPSLSYQLWSRDNKVLCLLNTMTRDCSLQSPTKELVQGHMQSWGERCCNKFLFTLCVWMQKVSSWLAAPSTCSCSRVFCIRHRPTPPPVLSVCMFFLCVHVCVIPRVGCTHTHFLRNDPPTSGRAVKSPLNLTCIQVLNPSVHPSIHPLYPVTPALSLLEPIPAQIQNLRHEKSKSKPQTKYKARSEEFPLCRTCPDMCLNEEAQQILVQWLQPGGGGQNVFGHTMFTSDSVAALLLRAHHRKMQHSRQA